MVRLLDIKILKICANKKKSHDDILLRVTRIFIASHSFNIKNPTYNRAAARVRLPPPAVMVAHYPAMISWHKKILEKGANNPKKSHDDIKTILFNREQLIAEGVVLGEVFLFFFFTYLYHSTQNMQNAWYMICYIIKFVGIRFLSLFNSQQCWEFADSADNFLKTDRIYGYFINLDSWSIHWFQVPTVLTVENLWMLIEFRFSQYPQIPWTIAAEL